MAGPKYKKGTRVHIRMKADENEQYEGEVLDYKSGTLTLGLAYVDPEDMTTKIEEREFDTSDIL